MVASQIVRLHQHEAVGWLLWDYAGRLVGLALLATIPSARAVAFSRHERRLPFWKIVAWIAGIVLADVYLVRWTRMTNAAFPITVLGSYPRPSGWLYSFDLVFGLVLVAFSEEIVFRRCAAHALRSHLGNGSLLILATSLLFGFYHWWAGLGHIVGRQSMVCASHALSPAIGRVMTAGVGALSDRLRLVRMSASSGDQLVGWTERRAPPRSPTSEGGSGDPPEHH
jgi:membrane protease YdiL (CAAX protease family)